MAGTAVCRPLCHLALSATVLSKCYQICSLIPLCFRWPLPPLTRAWLQPEELTLLLIQLRRHQAKLAGVHSPSNAFAHLQHHQHNGLLGHSMQVRDPHSCLMLQSASWPLFKPNCSCASLPRHLDHLNYFHVVVCISSTILAWAALYFLHDCDFLTIVTSLKENAIRALCGVFSFVTGHV